MRKKKKERKKSTRANINCEESCKKKMMAVLLHIHTMQWCYVDREELGASTTLFFPLLSLSLSSSLLLLGQWCIWHMSVSSFALLVFSSSRADEIKKKKKNQKKQMSPCYVERFACQWSLIDVSRFSYCVLLHLCINAISIYLLTLLLLFLSFRSYDKW
jgi:hypothetical protein